MAIDIAAVRHDTPATRSLTHANSAGCSIAPRQVVETVVTHLRLEAQRGGYEAESQQRTALSGIYDQVATLLGCTADEVGLFESGTAAWKAALDAVTFRSGDRILITSSEFGPHLSLYNRIAVQQGVRIEVIPDTAHGDIDTDALVGMVDDSVRIVSVPLVPANGAIVNPVQDIAFLLRSSDVTLVVDGAQAVGLFPLAMKQMGCDILTFSGRKYLRGPRGTGGLVIRRALFEQMAAERSDIQDRSPGSVSTMLPPKSLTRVRDLETRETNIAGRLGLGAAVSYALDVGMDDISTTTKSLADRLRLGLRSIDRVFLHDKAAANSSIISFTIDGISPDSVKEHLKRSAINVGYSYHQNTPIDTEARSLPTGVRISVHYFNTVDEIDLIVNAISTQAQHGAPDGAIR